MTKWFRLPQRHPSAILLMVQLFGVLLYPFIENTKHGHAGLNILGVVVLGMAIRTVHKTPGPTWISVALAVPIILLLGLQTFFAMPDLLPWSSALEAVFYFYAAGSLIAYMMGDYQTTVDELYAAAATFTLVVWAFDLAPISRTAGSLIISCLYGGSDGREVSTETAIHRRVQDRGGTLGRVCWAA